MSYKAFKEYFQSQSHLRKCSSAPDSGLASAHNAIFPVGDEENERKPPKASLKKKIEALDRLQHGLGAEDTERSNEVSDRCAPGNEGQISQRDSVKIGYLANGSQRHKSMPCMPLNYTEEGDKDDIRIIQLKDEKLASDSEAGLCAKPEPEGPFEPLVLWPPPGEGTSNLLERRTIQVPASINSRLFDHQREGVQFMYNLYRKDQGGILGDDMGLGKTIQTIAFLAAILEKDSESTESHVRPVVPVKVASQKERFPKVALVVCPTSVVKNWEQEFYSWGEFRVGICHGPQREFVLRQVAAKELEVVLTSHDTLRIYGDEFCGIDWDCVIVDEAHRLKNYKSQFYITCSKFKTRRRYGLTGTAMQNKLMELFNLFDWATPECLGSREHFREYYANPIADGQRISAPQRSVTISQDRKKHLNMLLRAFHLRRTKQETIGHLMRGKVDNVVFCPMSSLQKRVYKRVLQSPDYQALKEKGLPCTCGSPLKRGECCHRMVPNGVLWPALHKDNLEEGCNMCPNCLIFPCITKLRLLSNHLELLKPNPDEDQDKQDKDYKFAQMAFGEDADIAGGLEHDENFFGLSDSQHCGKMSALQTLLASWTAQGDKVLLFSDSVRMVNILDKFLFRKRYDYSRLDGQVPMNSRQDVVKDFNNSPSKQIFLISTRAGGLGLNLTSANRVVIFDPNWNPAYDLQAQDRSFRYGQNRHVTVFRFLAAGSLEELIYTRQIYKQQLFNIAMSGAPEKRYFEGVQGSKQHKGELFGLDNLFRDISDILFAEDIFENHEERLVRIQNMPRPEDNSIESLDLLSTDIEHAESEVDDEGALVLPMVADTEGPDQTPSEHYYGDTQEELRTQRAVHKGLRDAGVIYSHRNEDVVNFLPGVPTAHKVKQVEQASTSQNRKEEKINCTNVKLKKRKLSRRHHIQREPEAVLSRTSNVSAWAQPGKQSAMDDKKKLFAQLAKSKGMDLMEFSRWYSSATPVEKAKLPKDLVNL